jgi:hypothetical protein
VPEIARFRGLPTPGHLLPVLSTDQVPVSSNTRCLPPRRNTARLPAHIPTGHLPERRLTAHLPRANMAELPARLDRAKSSIVRDSAGQKLTYFYFEAEPGRKSAAKLLTRGDAHAPGAEGVQESALSTSERKPLRANVRTGGHHSSCKCRKRLHLQQQPRPRSKLPGMFAVLLFG